MADETPIFLPFAIPQTTVEQQLLLEPGDSYLRIVTDLDASDGKRDCSVNMYAALDYLDGIRDRHFVTNDEVMSGLIADLTTYYMSPNIPTTLPVNNCQPVLPLFAMPPRRFLGR